MTELTMALYSDSKNKEAVNCGYATVSLDCLVSDASEDGLVAQSAIAAQNSPTALHLNMI